MWSVHRLDQAACPIDEQLNQCWRAPAVPQRIRVMGVNPNDRTQREAQMEDDIRTAADRSEEPNLNTGTPWSTWDDDDIRRQLDHKTSIREIADFLCRTPKEIRQRILEIAEADAIGDPSLLRDGLLRRDRIALETYRDARTAMALIREAIEDCAPPGSVAREGYLSPEFTVAAEALLRGIMPSRRSRELRCVAVVPRRRGTS